MTFLQALGSVFSLLLLVLTAFILSARKYFPADMVKFLPSFITNVSLPPFLACTIIKSLQKDSLNDLLYGTLAPFILMFFLFILAFIVAKICQVPKKHFGLFCACVSNPNTIFIGIPVNIALFGEASLTYVLIYYFASTSFFWTVGNYFISRDESAEIRDEGQKVKNSNYRKIVSSPILGFLCGLIIIVFHIPVPAFIMQGASLLGQLTTPLALIFIGITLQQINWRSFHLSRDLVLALLGRMVLSPLLMMALLQVIQLPTLMGNVFIIQSSLPVLLQVAILSAYYKTDPQFGSIMVAISTLCCAITIPIYMTLI